MRLQPRYKQFSKPNRFLVELPGKIQTFKHSKWEFIKKKNLKASRKRIRQIRLRKNPVILTLKKKWERIQKSYKEGLNLKNAIISVFDNSITPQFLKKQLNLNSKKLTKSMLLDSLIKPLFRIDILLSHLFFFKTAYHARQYINSGAVLINFKKIKGNVFVKQGDVISFSTTNLDSFFYLNTFFKKMQKKNKLYSFLEYDVYTQTIVIVKDFKFLSWEDLILLFNKSIDLNQLKNYL